MDAVSANDKFGVRNFRTLDLWGRFDDTVLIKYPLVILGAPRSSAAMLAALESGTPRFLKSSLLVSIHK